VHHSRSGTTHAPCERVRRRAVLLLSLLAVACSGNDGATAAHDDDDGGATEPPVSSAVDAATEGGAVDAAPPDGSMHADSGAAHDAGTHHDAAPPDAGPFCKKHLTVVFAVGVGAGAVGAYSNGCWTVVDADGAANASFRKCSTSSFVVKNPSAPSYAYDDTNPTRPLSEDQNFLAQCSSGATGEGFEYMAYRGSWRLLTAPHLTAYFAELYSSDTTVDDNYAEWQTPMSGHTVSPMINIGPSDTSTIGASGLKMCGRVADKGYFGVYNGAWQQGMATGDPRAKALGDALDTCTGP
jgi:hypothetical protein